MKIEHHQHTDSPISDGKNPIATGNGQIMFKVPIHSYHRQESVRIAFAFGYVSDYLMVSYVL